MQKVIFIYIMAFISIVLGVYTMKNGNKKYVKDTCRDEEDSEIIRQSKELDKKELGFLLLSLGVVLSITGIAIQLIF